MSVVVVTGSGGLIGSEAASHFAGLGMTVVGIDNDMRRVFFGDEASTAASVARLEASLGTSYCHLNIDVRDRANVGEVFRHYGSTISLVYTLRRRPSHDWRHGTLTDFDINASGTVSDHGRPQYAPEAVCHLHVDKQGLW